MTTIRRAAPADVDALLPMVRDFHTHEGITQTDEVRRKVLAAVVAKPDLGVVLVAEGPLGLQGYLAALAGTSIEFGGRVLIVDELYIDPALRGQGIGRQLLAQAERYAQLTGVGVLILEVDDGKDRAFKLYSAQGYKRHPRRLMSKRVDPPPPSPP